ncbi:uncharacterized protein PHACADRAFT_265191 [Phanerochaete carnosa HHB-10118-sp]|uniref:L domain-like protein n=1 Tax=Phanerochaete carnosa (strain HHB-10118-sp) TaxID=650164 RepID=K5WHD3_PHACS|nr:uncharacterized protein PHACADRAFT_265191 [Phanerochaete carnosa HHB-10118-sp]EKM49632.1 hypothetical protein PHACADRAFT_265191 [Phanerochaete carnosa HHB-10118-sp]
MTHISPDDLPPLPDRVGKMVFDRQIMKWVKATAQGPPPTGLLRRDGSNESLDPFRDFESIRDDSPPLPEAQGHEEQEEVDMSLDASRVEQARDSEPEDAEEAELMSFSFDASAEPLAVQAVEAPNSQDSSDGVASTETSGQFPSANLADSFDAPHTAVQDLQQEPALEDTPPHQLATHTAERAAATPQSAAHATNVQGSSSSSSSSSINPAPTPLRSALKSTSATPVSAMRNPGRGRLETPAPRISHRRSVSFSDGRREGPIAGLGRNQPTPTPDGSILDDSAFDAEFAEFAEPDSGAPSTSTALVPSTRSKRIAEMLEGLEETSYDHDSPSKAQAASSASRIVDELQPLGARRPSGGGRSTNREIARRSTPGSGTNSARARRNGTFLTECSFGVAHDRLVTVITDVQPFEPYWEQLTSIDLNGRGLDSVARLKEFLPRLDSLSLNNNQISWLSGVPGTVRTLSVASNCLTAVTSFSHLCNLESLDISRNNVDSLRQLECLRHLRELRADGNTVHSLDGLQKMDGLVKLSLQGNALQGTLDLTSFRWTRLEMLNLSQNRLSGLVGLSSMPALIALNLDNNVLTELVAEGAMPRLRILRASGNRLHELNAAPFANLRTLYADSNALGPIHKAHRLTKLENLSLRNQGGRNGLPLSLLYDVRDARRLYLSGNPLKASWISQPCYNLVYLELAACRLTRLPADLARLAPNVRNLNLNYNFLEDVRPLEGLVRLRRLTLIGSRVQHTKQLVRVLRGMLDVEMLDFRMNPCTLGYYLPLLVRDIPGALQPSDGDRDPGPASSFAGAGAGAPAARRAQGDAPRARGAVVVVAAAAADTSVSVMPSLGNALPYSPGKRRRSSSPMPATSPSRDREREREREREGKERVGGWKELDAKFRRDLPDAAYAARLAYRGLVMRACPAVRVLDGVEVTDKERDKAECLLRSVLDGRRRSA